MTIIEITVFCLLTVAFLFLFKVQFLGNTSLKCKFAYGFLLLGIAVSLPTLLVTNLPAHVACAAVCAVCYALAAVLFIGNKKPYIFLPAFIGVGGSSFFLLYKGLNLATYVLVLTTVVTFAVEQYNKIRVDNLTKLYNRYGMELELKEQLRQYKHEHTDSFYIIACDLDKFKHINDTWGHLEGDRALVLVANALAKVGKAFNAAVFRIGGDEFVIITDTSEEGLAQEVAKAVERELDNIVFRDDFTIEMSIGTALYDGVSTIDELLNNADKKLYEAKRKN